ncbi:MAG: hypothetical protein DWQ37_15355 [Planctomycetota bacterium]|nr:MAG: hypothetical protein DWQ37_15355 [Planctomycetota bacterium]
MSGFKLPKTSIAAWIWAACCALVAGGCTSGPYEYGRFDTANDHHVQEVAVDVGEPHQQLDRMSDAISWPARKLFPDRPDKRVIQPETTERVATYLQKNDLSDVYVSVRDYQPKDQWRRLRSNERLSPLVRYSLGSLSVARYTLLPDRVFGGNRYNPYTNTLYVNSDRPAAVLYEAAFAKNMRSRRLPGAYAAMSSLPILSLRPAIDGAEEVLGYAQTESDWELEQDTYRQVYPRVVAAGARGGSQFVPVWWGGPVLGLGGAAVGGVAGQAMLARRESQRKEAHLDDETAQQAAWTAPPEGSQATAVRHAAP